MSPHTVEQAARPQILVITGISGAGRSTAANTLEDEGWYVVDNIPPQMFGALAQLVKESPATLPKVAVGIDIRARRQLQNLPEAINELRASDVDFSILFMDASDRDIIARYEAQRRPHPLQQGGQVAEAIAQERRIFAELRDTADHIIDTTGMNVHQLAKKVRETYAPGRERVVNITLMSFGFKYGTPSDAHFMADMRFIPNPHWVPEFRPLTGQDAGVRDFVFAQQGTELFIANFIEALKPVIEGYRREGKLYATFAIGCTGGKHRSVAVTEEIAQRLAELEDVTISVHHRDMGRE
ncbi:RNase adaptor protein RapZ [Rothia nasimurium]|uniref:RNase adaptor protein RapZ n=1 Tax=Rothia nasimurium TaxID=85336 RepID=A0A1Y1RNR5_9MICC|nr:RNase adapter RapZ [Rothia nasimurium]ORC15742.1 RNase adaptor protein RapZ [Rothia nasimurium]